VSLSCARPDLHRLLPFPSPGGENLRWEFDPGIADSGLQGTANSPSSTGEGDLIRLRWIKSPGLLVNGSQFIVYSKKTT